MALSAFRYVWPSAPSLRFRLFICFILVMLERGVNLAVPIFYKRMVDTLSEASSAIAASHMAGAGAGGEAATAPRQLAALLQAGAHHITALADQPLAANCASAVAMLRAISIPFWSVFYPWVFGYLVFYFLRGGSGAEGLLANIRDLLFIPITQVRHCARLSCLLVYKRAVARDGHCCSDRGTCVKRRQ